MLTGGETRAWLEQLHREPRQAMYSLIDEGEEGEAPYPDPTFFEQKDWEQLKKATLAEKNKIPGAPWWNGAPKEYQAMQSAGGFVRFALARVASSMRWTVWATLWHIQETEALAQLWPDPDEFSLSSAGWSAVPAGPLVLADASERCGRDILLIPPSGQALKFLVESEDKRIRELAWRLAGQVAKPT